MKAYIVRSPGYDFQDVAVVKWNCAFDTGLTKRQIAFFQPDNEKNLILSSPAVNGRVVC